jgi:hypothetical protein
MAIALAAGAAGAAEADDAALAGARRRVTLDVAGCPPSAEAPLRKMIGIEIGDLLVGAAEPAPAAEGDRLIITCDGDQVHVEAVRRQRLDRLFKLTDFPDDAAPRALALIALEALASLSPEVRGRMQGQALGHDGTAAAALRPAALAGATASPGRTPPLSVAAPPVPARPASGVAIGAVARAFLTGPETAAWGARLALDHDVASRWTVGGDVEVARARADSGLGQSTGLLISGAAFAGARAQGQALAARAALGGRIGLARLAGEPAAGSGLQAGSALRPWAGPALALQIATGGRLQLDLSVEAGLALIGAQGLAANGASILAVSGAWLAVSFGVGYRF